MAQACDAADNIGRRFLEPLPWAVFQFTCVAMEGPRARTLSGRHIACTKAAGRRAALGGAVDPGVAIIAFAEAPGARPMRKLFQTSNIVGCSITSLGMTLSMPGASDTFYRWTRKLLTSCAEEWGAACALPFGVVSRQPSTGVAGALIIAGLSLVGWTGS